MVWPSGSFPLIVIGLAIVALSQTGPITQTHGTAVSSEASELRRSHSHRGLLEMGRPRCLNVVRRRLLQSVPEPARGSAKRSVAGLSK